MRGLGLHIHHDILFEWCSSLEERQKYVWGNKPAGEVPLRLCLIQVIDPALLSPELRAALDQALAALDRAWSVYKLRRGARNRAAAYNRASAAYNQAVAAYDQALDAYNHIVAANMPELLALHARICPNCPWNGNTIFSAE